MSSTTNGAGTSRSSKPTTKVSSLRMIRPFPVLVPGTTAITSTPGAGTESTSSRKPTELSSSSPSLPLELLSSPEYYHYHQPTTTTTTVSKSKSATVSSSSSSSLSKGMMGMAVTTTSGTTTTNNNNPSTNCTTPDSNSENRYYSVTTSVPGGGGGGGVTVKSKSKGKGTITSSSFKTTSNTNDDVLLDEVIVAFDHQLTSIAASVSPSRSRGTQQGKSSSSNSHNTSTILQSNSGGSSESKTTMPTTRTSRTPITVQMNTTRRSGRTGNENDDDDNNTSTTNFDQRSNTGSTTSSTNTNSSNSNMMKSVVTASSRSVFSNRYHRLNLTDKTKNTITSSESGTVQSATTTTSSTNNDTIGTTPSSTTTSTASSLVSTTNKRLAPKMNDSKSLPVPTSSSSGGKSLTKEIAAAAIDTANSIIDEIRNVPTDTSSRQASSSTTTTTASILHTKRWNPEGIPGRGNTTTTTTTIPDNPTAGLTSSSSSSMRVRPSSSSQAALAVDNTNATPTQSSSSSATSSTPMLRPSYRLAAALLGPTITTPPPPTTTTATPTLPTGTSGQRKGKDSTTSNNNNKKLITASARQDDDVDDSSNNKGDFPEEKKEDDKVDFGITTTSTTFTMVERTGKYKPSIARSSSVPQRATTAATASASSSVSVTSTLSSPALPPALAPSTMRYRYGRSAALKKKTKQTSSSPPSENTSTETSSSPPVPSSLSLSSSVPETAVAMMTTCPTPDVKSIISSSDVIIDDDNTGGIPESVNTQSATGNKISSEDEPNMSHCPPDDGGICEANDLHHSNIIQDFSTEECKAQAESKEIRNGTALLDPKLMSSQSEDDSSYAGLVQQLYNKQTKAEEKLVSDTGSHFLSSNEIGRTRGSVLQTWRTKVQNVKEEDSSNGMTVPSTDETASNGFSGTTTPSSTVKYLPVQNTDDQDYVPLPRSRFDIVAASNESWSKQSQLKKKASELPCPANNTVDSISTTSSNNVGTSVIKDAQAKLETKLGNTHPHPISSKVVDRLQTFSRAPTPVNDYGGHKISQGNSTYSNNDTHSTSRVVNQVNTNSKIVSTQYNGASYIISSSTQDNSKYRTDPKVHTHDSREISSLEGTEEDDVTTRSEYSKNGLVDVVRYSTGKVSTNSNEGVVASWRNRLKHADTPHKGLQSTSGGLHIVEPQPQPEEVVDDTQQEKTTETETEIKETKSNKQAGSTEGSSILAVWRNRIGKGCDDISTGPKNQSKADHSQNLLPVIPPSNRMESKVTQTSTSSVQKNHFLKSNHAHSQSDVGISNLQVESKKRIVGTKGQNDNRPSNIKQIQSNWLSRPTGSDECSATSQSQPGSVLHQVIPVSDTDENSSQCGSETGSTLPEQLSQVNRLEQTGDTGSVSVASRRQMFMQKMNIGSVIVNSSSHSSSTKKYSKLSVNNENFSDRVQNKTIVPANPNPSELADNLPTLSKPTVKQGIAQKWRQWEEANTNGMPVNRMIEQVNYPSITNKQPEVSCGIPNADSYASSYTSIDSFGPIDDIPSELSPQSSGDYCNRPSQFKMSTSSSVGSNEHIVHKKQPTTVSLPLSVLAHPTSGVKKVDERTEQHKSVSARMQQEGIPRNLSVTGITKDDGRAQIAGTGSASVSAMKAQLWAVAPNGALVLNVTSIQKATSIDEESSSFFDYSDVLADESEKTEIKELPKDESIEKQSSVETMGSVGSLDCEGFNTSYRVIPNRPDVSTPIGMTPPQRSEKMDVSSPCVVQNIQKPKSDPSVEKLDTSSIINNNSLPRLESVNQVVAPIVKDVTKDQEVALRSEEDKAHTCERHEKKSIKKSILSWMNESFMTSSRRLNDSKAKPEESVEVSNDDMVSKPDVDTSTEIRHDILVATTDHVSDSQPDESVLGTNAREDVVLSKPPKHNGGNQFEKHMINTGLEPKSECADDAFDGSNVPLYRSVSLGDFQENISPEKPASVSESLNNLGDVVDETTPMETSATIENPVLEFDTNEVTAHPVLEFDANEVTAQYQDDEHVIVDPEGPIPPLPSPNLNSVSRKGDRPWNKDQRTLSPELWQKKKTILDVEELLLNGSSHIKDQLALAEIVPQVETSMDSIQNFETEHPLVATHEGMVATENEKSHAENNISICEISSSSLGIVFGNPDVFGAAGGEDDNVPSLSVSERARALEKWQGGLGVPQRQVDKQDIIRKEIGRSLSPIPRSTINTQSTNCCDKSNEHDLEVVEVVPDHEVPVQQGKVWTSLDADFGIPDDYEVFDVEPLNSSLISKEKDLHFDEDKNYGWSADDIPDFPSCNNISLTKNIKEADLFDPFSTVDEDFIFSNVVANTNLEGLDMAQSVPRDIVGNRKSENEPNGFDPFAVDNDMNRLDEAETSQECYPDPFAVSDPFSPESVASFKMTRVQLAPLKKNLSIFDPFCDDGFESSNDDAVFDNIPDMFSEPNKVKPKKSQDMKKVEYFNNDFFMPKPSRKDFRSGYDADQSNLHDSNFEI